MDSPGGVVFIFGRFAKSSCVYSLSPQFTGSAQSSRTIHRTRAIYRQSEPPGAK